VLCIGRRNISTDGLLFLGWNFKGWPAAGGRRCEEQTDAR